MLLNEKNRTRSKDSIMRILNAIVLSMVITVAAGAAEAIYDETADARLDIQHALTAAATNQTPVIIVFGANWCPDCKMLDRAMKAKRIASLLNKDFKIVHVNVGNPDTNVVGHFDKNVDVAQSYGVPLELGIPTVAIISAKNEVLYVTKERELSKARKIGEKGIYDFFKKVTADAGAKK